ncbi:MAG: Mrp/NBP35 family ATP-binding protein [Bacilli bacterium]|nr:Mrp/NBP35 family ATP-binding protein [Bacilli bacterium]
MPECDQNCSACGENCSERQEPQSFLATPNPNSHIKKVIAVVSGKGGVGKSLTTSLLAVNARRDGKKVAVLDADVTGPSIPTIFGLSEMATASETEIYPVNTSTGIETMSLNLLTEDPAEPVVWRGPVISGLIKQFWTDVAYGDIDEMYVDMPPGTGDVPLTVFQSLPVDGIVIVTSPQDLVSLIVEKAVRMAGMMNIPVLGIVMNMSYLTCPKCGEKIYPFGKNDDDLAKKYGFQVIEHLPIDPKLATLCDKGAIETYEGDYLKGLTKLIHDIEK